MDWLLASLNTPYVAVFKDAKNEPAERAPDFAAQSADLVAQLKILDGHIAGKSYFALDRLTARRYRARADRQALPRIPDREAGLPGADALDEVDRGAAGLCGRDRREALRAQHRSLRRTERWRSRTRPHAPPDTGSRSCPPRTGGGARAARPGPDRPCRCSMSSMRSRAPSAPSCIGVDEVLVFGMIWMVMLGMLLVTADRGHIALRNPDAARRSARRAARSRSSRMS